MINDEQKKLIGRMIIDKEPNPIKEKREVFLAKLTKFFFTEWGKTIGYEHEFMKHVFLEPHKENKDFMRRLRSFLSSQLTTNDDLVILCYGLERQVPRQDENILPFLKELEHFIDSGFITYDGNSVNFETPVLDFNKSTKDWNKMVNNSKAGAYDGFIMPDGTIYFAGWEHELLSHWLYSQNIALDGVLRFNQARGGYGYLSLSSLFSYNYGACRHCDKTLILTDAQAKSLYGLFNRLKPESSKKLHGYSFADMICDCSENLGACYIDDHTGLKYNFYTLEEQAGIEDFCAKENLDRVIERLRVSEERIIQRITGTVDIAVESKKTDEVNVGIHDAEEIKIYSEVSNKDDTVAEGVGSTSKAVGIKKV